MILRKKLIEVALPLDAINKASAREKSIRHGHPSTLHLWWARRPLAAARAVIFAQMVDDPSTYVDELRQNARLRRKAETLLKARTKVWAEAKRFADFAATTNTPAPEPGPEPALDDILAEIERGRLFQIIEELVLWENTTNEEVLQRARDEIRRSWRRACAENIDHPRAKELFDPESLPAFHDPFAGGGALPLEAQRLGLEAYASDLNPVAVLINKAMIEIPPKFAGQPPVNPQARSDKKLFDRQWRGAQGLAEDVRYYGQWMRDEAEKRIGHLYPKVQAVRNPDGTYRHATQAEIENQESKIENLTVIAWIWARTVKSPNPAFGNVDVPLASTFMLSTKAGKEAYVEPVIEDGGYRFVVKIGKPQDLDAAKKGTKLSRGANFRCIMSGTPIAPDHIYREANSGRMAAGLMAIVAEGSRSRVYLAPTSEMEAVALSAQPTWAPELEMPDNPRWFSPPLYGLKTYGDLFTPRQLVALTTFSDLVQEAREEARRDALAANLPDDGRPLRDRGGGAVAYSEALCVYLAFAIDKAAEGSTTICTWSSLPSKLHVVSTFGRQALPMTWDYAETNFFAESSGNIYRMCELVAKVIEPLSSGCSKPGESKQRDAAKLSLPAGRLISTDPPYYDNIGYADLSDFFYVWLRLALRNVFPDLFATLVVPKVDELVATPYRHGSKEEANAFFLNGMTQAMCCLSEQAQLSFPVTIYYAFKQSQTDTKAGSASTGWETFLGAVIRANFGVSGTWPVRTERAGGFRNKDQNALASSIVLVCRKRTPDAPSATRREFIATLKRELPDAVRLLQSGNIAPVDLAQAAIGPGMAVYTRYARVLDAEGRSLSVREALALINQTLDEALAEQEGDFDADSRWALSWFEQQGFDEGEFGVADVLARAKNTSVQGMVEAGILISSRGKVRLLTPEELPADWDPATDKRLTAWEMVHHLIRRLEAGGETAAADLIAQLGTKAEVARELCYRLYTLCERKKRAPQALAYNALVQCWPELTKLVHTAALQSKRTQTVLDF